VTPAEAVELAAGNGGEWVAYSQIVQAQIKRPGLLARRWRATIETRGGELSFDWRGTRPHGMLLWTYLVAKCGLERVEGRP
jgi:predicted carbohydrate-binding protein with CBM5 and CBM33 domain